MFYFNVSPYALPIFTQSPMSWHNKSFFCLMLQRYEEKTENCLTVLLINLQVLTELDILKKLIFFKIFNKMSLFLTYLFYLIEIVFYLGFTIL